MTIDRGAVAFTDADPREATFADTAAPGPLRHPRLVKGSRLGGVQK